jgi:hypothetical protein
MCAASLTPLKRAAVTSTVVLRRGTAGAASTTAAGFGMYCTPGGEERVTVRAGAREKEGGREGERRG